MTVDSKTSSSFVLFLVQHVLPCQGGKSAQGPANVPCRHLYIAVLTVLR